MATLFDHGFTRDVVSIHRPNENEERNAVTSTVLREKRITEYFTPYSLSETSASEAGKKNTVEGLGSLIYIVAALAGLSAAGVMLDRWLASAN
ncbi:hypothetical protein LY78DRAFT_657874 [Colletotrichum sublineola]|nr:hypothetical protein LY78DRAFT_657874 [Colletotrichum sublineola]